MLTPLDEYVLAYFLAVDAPGVNVDGRFYRRAEFIQIFEDRFAIVTRQFGGQVAGPHSNIVGELVDRLIEEKALTTVHDRLSGTSHQMDTIRYRAVIRLMTDSNEICQRARGDPQFWEHAFATPNRGVPPE